MNSSFLLVSNDDTYEFVGTLQLEDKSLLSYKLIFTDSNGIITGTSITDFTGKHRTETQIEGTLDRKKNIISFNETQNLSTKSDVASDDFCYVHLYNAKIKLRKRKSIIQGHFYSRYKNNELCIEGDIYLVSENFFNKKIKKIQKNVKRFAPEEKKEKIVATLEKELEERKLNIIKEGETLTLESKTPVITLAIWDDQYIDGDKISIYQENTLLFNNILVGETVKHYDINLVPGENTIIIEAQNEGSIPPNSANIIINSDELNIPVSVRLLKDKKASIKFIYSENE